MRTERTGFIIRALTAAAALGLALPATALPGRLSPAELVDRSNVKGGLIVHLGCGDGRRTVGISTNAGFLVQALDRHPQNVKLAREYIRSRGNYGQFIVDRITGRRLPYVDNLVNMIIAEEQYDISSDEFTRVLAPKGIAWIKKGGTWTKTEKPRPAEIDEWTHYLHDASNNAVAHDSIVGPPRHLQWVGSPNWARHHDRIASLSALVSANGRIFYIFDKGPTAAVMLPPDWTLVARDAFNGTILWEKSLPSWHPHLWPMKSGFAQLPRRLVAVGDRVYVTLGIEAPLTCLDAATGKILKTYESTTDTEEIILSQGKLFLLVNPAPNPYKDKFQPAYKTQMWSAMRRAAHDIPWNRKPRQIVALDAETGRIRWAEEHRVSPLTLAADDQGVYFHNGENILRLDRQTGKELWNSEKIGVAFPKHNFTGSKAKGSEVWKPDGLSGAFIPASYAPTLVVHEDVVLFSGGDGTMTALSRRDGSKLWDAEHHPSGHFSPQDLFVIDGLAWSGAIALPERIHSGGFRGHSLHTGELIRELPCDTEVFFMHQRCYRSKATDRYFIPSRTGTEFIDLEEGHWQVHHWVRGGCMYGIMPCNGMLYAPPHSCACYMLAKLNGFNALAPASASRSWMTAVRESDRIEQGPAFGMAGSDVTEADRSGDWPTYRHDAARSGATDTTVTSDLKQAWKTQIGGTLSPIVAAGGRVFLARLDTHTVYAIDQDSGAVAWSFTAGGKVDSPPTIHGDKAIFGCADGFVYCLRASDGTKVWKFRAAPGDCRVVAFEQIESLWPLHGSVLVLDGAVYCVAGRSMFLDGGLRLFKLDPETGRKLYETVLDEFDPELDQNLQVHIKGHNMPTALPDVLSSDGKFLFMRTQRFTLAGERRGIAPLSANQTQEAAMQKGEGTRLFSPVGFLDGSWWHRAYWVYGTRFAAGAGGYSQAGKFAPAGRILVHDQTNVYGYGRKPSYFRWTTPLEYRLFSASTNLINREIPVGRAPKGKQRRTIPATAPDVRWSHDVPFQARGMVLAGNVLFAAGPPDVVDEEKAFYRLNEKDMRGRLSRQAAALHDAEGAILSAVATEDGETLDTFRLPSVPVWDGMIAADERLYVAGLDGSLRCLGKKGTALEKFTVEQREFRRPDLVGYWKFDENGGPVAKDSSERINDGGVQASWTKGILGTALNFDGKDSCVEIPETESLNITGEITLMAWIKPEDQPSELPMIITKLGNRGRYILRLDGELHLMALFWENNERAASITSKTAISKNWHHVAVTYDPLKSGKLRLFLDGQIVAEQDNTRDWGNPAGNPVSISGRQNKGFKGVIDEVRIYSRGLTPDEIREIVGSRL